MNISLYQKYIKVNVLLEYINQFGKNFYGMLSIMLSLCLMVVGSK